MAVLIIMVITTGTPIIATEIVVADSETKAAVTKTIKETRTAKAAVDSGIPETLTITAAQAAGQNLQEEDSEAAQVVQAVPKAVALKDNRAAEAALDKTIINKETNS